MLIGRFFSMTNAQVFISTRAGSDLVLLNAYAQVFISTRAGSDREANMLVIGLCVAEISLVIFIESLCALLSLCRTNAV